jgi:hypothetical protein
MTKKTREFCMQLAIVSVLACGLMPASAPKAQLSAATLSAGNSQGRKSGFGRPESIAGTVSLVNPEEGLLIVTQRGPGQPPSTQISGTTVVTQNSDGTSTAADTAVTAGPGPGETEYRFRITSATLIQANGQRVTPTSLAGMQGKQVTVHFVPERNGNFAKGIEVSP